MDLPFMPLFLLASVGNFRARIISPIIDWIFNVLFDFLVFPLHEDIYPNRWKVIAFSETGSEESSDLEGI